MYDQKIRLLKVANRIARFNPEAGRELERQVRALTAAVNPGAKSFGEHLEETTSLLKSLEQELKDVLKRYEDDEDIEEFAKFFDDEAKVEAEELSRLLKDVRSASSRVAGPTDWLKKLFRGKKTDDAKDAKTEDSPYSYDLDESSIDEFVEGKRNWEDPTNYVDAESGENKEFFDGADSVIKEMKKLRDKPTKKGVEALLETVSRLVRKGEALAKGVRNYLKEPTRQIDLSDEGMGESDKKPSSKKKEKPTGVALENTVGHYVDMLKESLGDEKKTVQYLKELFKAIEPLVVEDKAALASARRQLIPVLLKVAQETPRTRPVLVPVIRRMAAVR